MLSLSFLFLFFGIVHIDYAHNDNEVIDLLYIYR
jgi:hypothetical protein